MISSLWQFFQSHCIDGLMLLCIPALNHERGAVADDGTGSGTASSSNKTAYGPRFVTRTQPRSYDRQARRRLEIFSSLHYPVTHACTCYFSP